MIKGGKQTPFTDYLRSIILWLWLGDLGRKDFLKIYLKHWLNLARTLGGERYFLTNFSEQERGRKKGRGRQKKGWLTITEAF